ncbi:hypothetical protein ACFV20_19515 [Streptomyces sp. NPDC059696]|uniref:hypothetical protein n=1 Tax=Streptomyces sp. NPDC059696 TaxID=3346911 RepID=UPI00368DAB69
MRRRDAKHWKAKSDEATTLFLRERKRRLDAEEALAEKTAREAAADASAAETINRLHGEATALRGIVAAQVVALETAGRGDEALALRQQLGSAGVDLTVEIEQRQPSPGALPAARTYTPAESRLVGELFRRNKAAGALEDQLFEVQRVNEAQARMLRAAEESAA